MDNLNEARQIENQQSNNSLSFCIKNIRFIITNFQISFSPLFGQVEQAWKLKNPWVLPGPKGGVLETENFSPTSAFTLSSCARHCNSLTALRTPLNNKNSYTYSDVIISIIIYKPIELFFVDFAPISTSTRILANGIIMHKKKPLFEVVNRVIFGGVGTDAGYGFARNAPLPFASGRKPKSSAGPLPEGVTDMQTALTLIYRDQFPNKLTFSQGKKKERRLICRDVFGVG